MLTSETVEILAHQGGWDELLLFGGPVAVMVLLGYLARRGMARADSESVDESEDGAVAADADVNASERDHAPLGTSAVAPAAQPPAGPAPSRPPDPGPAPPHAGA